MMRRFWLGVALGCATMLAAAAGCQPRQNMYVRTPTTVAEGHAPAEIAADVDPDELKAPKGFFKNNRLPGGWSSQANDIEKSLGVSGN